MENRKLRLTPKKLCNNIAEALQDLDTGRTHGSYATAEAAIKALEKRAKPYAKKQGK